MSDSPGFPGDLAQRYEELRSGVVGGRPDPGRGLGLAMLLTHGLPAWMTVWSNCFSEPAPRPSATHGTLPLHPSAHPEVVHLLTGMALSNCEEATP